LKAVSSGKNPLKILKYATKPDHVSGITAGKVQSGNIQEMKLNR